MRMARSIRRSLGLGDPFGDGIVGRHNGETMCRNIRVLTNFQPPTTHEEIQAAALQYVRKVSGLNKPSAVDEAIFAQAIADVAAATEKLVGAIHVKAPARTREGEREKGRMRFMKRQLAAK